MKRYITVSERKRKTAKRRQRKAAKYQVSYQCGNDEGGTKYTAKGKHNRPVAGPDMLEQIKSGKPMAPTYRLMAISFEPHLPECWVSTILLGINALPIRMLPSGRVKFDGRVQCFETALFSSDDTIINRRFTYGDSKDLHMLIATAYLMKAHTDGKELPPALAAILDKYSKPARYASEYKRLYQKIKPFFDTTTA